MNFQRILCVWFLIFFKYFVIFSATAVNIQQSKWRIEFTEVTIKLDPELGRLKGYARLCLNNTNSGSGDISLDLNRELKVLSVIGENNQPLSYERTDASLIIHCSKRLCNSDTLNLYIRYEGSFTDRVPELNLLNAWIGPKISYALYRSRWYPELSGPVRRSKGRIIYHIPRNWVVASVGKLVSEESLVEEKICIFEIGSPIEFSFAVAPFTFLHNNIDGLDVGIYLLNSDLKKAQFYLENCVKIVRFLKSYYGIFPYEGYSLIEIPPDLLGNSGGGSYEGLTFYTSGVFADKLFFTPVFAHEIGHFWWGNYIRSPEGPVINEGLAQMSMGLYLEHVLGEKIFHEILKNGAPEFLLGQSARLYFRSISTVEPDEQLLLRMLLIRGEDLELGIFRQDKFQTLHMLANSKGFFIYSMLRDYIGQKAFQKSLRRAMTRFAWRNTITLTDMRLEFEKASGRNLKWFFNQWFFRKGAPEFSISYRIKNQNGNYQVRGIINQIREVYKVSAEIAFINGETREIRNVNISTKKTPFSFRLLFQPDTVLFDPDYKILRWIEEFKN